ncbi:MAG: glycosyltransferase [Romboutsia sp.]
MKKLISVIVPIYNVEQYLPKCIESIINQTINDIEIILVNDGSTDNSGEIADNYAKNDQRIKVIHKENGGQGSARNKGIDIAKGEYIGFVDSDDWVDLDMYEKLYKNAKEENLDIAVCSRKIWSEDNELGFTLEVKNEIVNNVIKDVPNYIINYLLYSYTVSTCNKIYKSKIIKKSNILFDSVENIGSEDALFNYCLLLNIQRIGSIKGTYYNGLERMGSTTRFYKKGSMKRTSNLLEGIYKYSGKVNRIEIAENVAPILLLFFQQWNYNYIKTYAKGNLVDNLVDEHREAGKSQYFRRAEKDFIFKKHMNSYVKNMGYSSKGKLFMNLYMGLSFIGLYKLASKVRSKVQ